MCKLPKVSIIIPVYNTELYLDRCITSILNQTVTDFELILIDDGSTDNSGCVCDKYAQEDFRIKVIHKKNDGQGMARNDGLDICLGSYITFIDSDDYVTENYLEILLNNAENYKADISCARIYHCENRTDALTSTEVKKYNNQLAMKKFVNDEDGLDHTPVAKLFRREVLENVRFMKLRGYEDAATIHKAFINAVTIVSQNYSIYFYYLRENSTMQRPFSEKDFDRIVAYKEMEKDLIKANRYCQESFIVTSRKIGAIYYVVGELMRNSIVNRKKILTLCQKEAKETLNSGQSISTKNKILLNMICVFPKVFGLIYKVGH